MSDTPPLVEAMVAAATVLLVRDAPGGADTADPAGSGRSLELLMVRRNSKISFGGAWAFPGGRVDPHEAEAANGDELVAARLAATREVAEETTLMIDGDSLVPWSHWMPPPDQKRRFSTWFFLCSAPPGEVTIDRGELQESAWLAPEQALARHRAGEIELYPPTWITLHQLSAFGSAVQAQQAASERTAERFATHVLSRDPLTLSWAGDAGYESGDPDLAGPRHRLIVNGTDWRYDRRD